MEEIDPNLVSEHLNFQDGGVPLVFFRETAIFGERRPSPTEWLKHAELYKALGSVIDPTHIAGLQRVRGMWRIYLDNLEDKVSLMADGFPLPGKTMQVLKTNPLRFDGELTTRVRIKDIPLSVDDGIIERIFILKSLKCIGKVEREKLRVNGRLTNCSTGDRIVIVKSLTLKEPLPRQMMFGKFKATIYYPGQTEIQKKQTCSQCLDPGHKFKDCLNDFKCLNCLQSGLRKGDCPQSLNPVATPTNGMTEETGEIENDESTDKVETLISPSVPLEARRVGNQRKPSAHKQKYKQNVPPGQQIIDGFLTGMKNRTETPNKGKQRSIVRSPPTPAERLNDDAKKQCTYDSDDPDSDT